MHYAGARNCVSGANEAQQWLVASAARYTTLRPGVLACRWVILSSMDSCRDPNLTSRDCSP